MVETYLRRSPLAHRALLTKAVDAIGDADLGLGERAHRVQINLRGDSGNPAFLAAVKTAAGLDIPVQANRYTASGDRACLWLGPNEWLILGGDGAVSDLIRDLRAALEGQHAAVTD